MTLREIQAEIGAWHREQFPDVPFEAIRDKLESELREYFYARTMYLASRSAENKEALKAEAADVLITIIGDLERLPGANMFPDGSGSLEENLDRKWAEVKQRDYRGRK